MKYLIFKIKNLQHVLYESLSCIKAALIVKGHQLSSTHLYQNESLAANNDNRLAYYNGQAYEYTQRKYLSNFNYLQDQPALKLVIAFANKTRLNNYY